MSETSDNISTAIICVGSNVPSRVSNINNAIDTLKSHCDIIDCTMPYECPDDSGLGAPYVNMVLKCHTRTSLQTFRNLLKDLEKQFGRNSSSKQSGIMPLDIDIVVWQGMVIDSYEYSRPYFRIGLERLQP